MSPTPVRLAHQLDEMLFTELTRDPHASAPSQRASASSVAPIEPQRDQPIPGVATLWLRSSDELIAETEDLPPPEPHHLRVPLLLVAIGLVVAVATLAVGFALSLPMLSI